jgi:hypothetical protein
MRAMELFSRLRRTVDLLCKLPTGRIPEAEFAAAESWLDEKQWLAGLPAGFREPVVWGWWRPQ